MKLSDAVLHIVNMQKEAQQTLDHIQKNIMSNGIYDTLETIRLDGLILGYKRAISIMHMIDKN
ncbi:MAG: hypothetical protein WC503_01240 [Candidatus Shapirobacteria bacterium]